MHYEVEEDTLFLLDNIKPKGKIIEIGAGSGYISFYLGAHGFDVTATDIDDDAIGYMKKIANEKNLNIKIVKSDLFKNITEKFDTIIFNPPYLPGNIEEDRAIFGGENGQEIIENFLGQAGEHLKNDGRIFIILSSYNDIQKLKEKFSSFEFIERARKNFFFHSIFLYELKKI
ncbi:MAG: methyltransferase [Thermoplasmata archaeon]